MIAALELINVNSDDFIEEIDAHLQNNYRFRKFANEAVKTDGAWLIHNRSLEEAFGKARKRLQHGEGLGQSKTISVTTQCGFLFTKNWSVVESIACNGLKTGNVQDTWLGKPKNGEQAMRICITVVCSHFGNHCLIIKFSCPLDAPFICSIQEGERLITSFLLNLRFSFSKRYASVLHGLWLMLEVDPVYEVQKCQLIMSEVFVHILIHFINFVNTLYELHRCTAHTI